MRPFSSVLLALALLVPSFAAEALPKVLIIGDVLHRSIAASAATELKGRANLVIPSTDPGDTGAAVSRLDILLGDEAWDLIHFNFGFADLRHIDPKTRSVRAMSRHTGGVRTTSPGEYEANLRKIVTRLQKSGAKLVWANTTPLMGSKYDDLYEPGSEEIYNAIAAKVMKEANIPINDMHGWVQQNAQKHTDPFSYRRIPIHEAMAACLEENLDLK